MTTALIIFLSGTLGAIAGYALGEVISATSALHFGKWNVLNFKGITNRDNYYFIAQHDKSEITVVLNKNGDFDVLLEDNRNAK